MEYAAETLTYREFAMGLWFPDQAQVIGPAPGVEPAGVFRVVADFELDRFSPRYHLVSVRLYKQQRVKGKTLPGSGPEIDTERYRSLRLMELRAGLASELGVIADDLPDDAQRESWLPQPLPWLSNSDIDLVRAAHIYVRSKMSGGAPQKEVSEQMGISIATAGRWVRRARDKGLMKSEGF